VYRNELIATVKLAHYYKSAFTPEQVHSYMRQPINKIEFDRLLQQLLDEGQIESVDGALFANDLTEPYRLKKDWSRKLFSRNRRLLKWLTRMPWVRFAALTGANSFESCRKEDDIDLFLVTSPQRLWICYVLLVVFSKLLRKRGIFCLNYLIDEDNLEIRKKDYYTAVQLTQMVPLIENNLAAEIRDKNEWVFSILPNARDRILKDRYYLLNKRKRRSKLPFSPLSALNQLIFRSYKSRLKRKYPQEFGKGIVLDIGVAQLNRVDHHDSYVEIYSEIEAAS